MVRQRETEPAGENIRAIQLPVDPESLRQAGWAAREVPVEAGIAPAAPGCVRPFDDLSCPQQQSGGIAGPPAHHVGAVVHPVGEVHVQVPRLTEHRRVAGRLSAIGMGAGVLRPHVRLHLGDAHRDRLRAVVVRQVCAKQERCNLDGRVRKPGALKCWIHAQTVSRRKARIRTVVSDFR